MTKYIVIYQVRNDGNQWRLWHNGVFDTSDDALREMRQQAPQHKNARFEMHPVDDHLWSAMRREAEIWQRALHPLQTVV